MPRKARNCISCKKPCFGERCQPCAIHAQTRKPRVKVNFGDPRSGAFKCTNEDFNRRDSQSQVIAPRSWWADPMPYDEFADKAATEFLERMRFNPQAQPKTHINWGD